MLRVQIHYFTGSDYNYLILLGYLALEQTEGGGEGAHPHPTYLKRLQSTWKWQRPKWTHIFIIQPRVKGPTSLYTVTKVIDFPRYNMKCSRGNVILRRIFQVVSGFPLLFMLYHWYYLDCFSNSICQWLYCFIRAVESVYSQSGCFLLLLIITVNIKILMKKTFLAVLSAFSRKNKFIIPVCDTEKQKSRQSSSMDWRKKF